MRATASAGAMKNNSCRFTEIVSNSSVLQGLLSDLLAIHEGEFALMRLGQVVDFYRSKIEALDEAEKRFSRDHLYSIHEIVAESAIVGFYWDAEPRGDDRFENRFHLLANDHHPGRERSERMERERYLSRDRAGYGGRGIRNLY